MWDVSQFLLDEGIRKSILEVIKRNMDLKDENDIKGIDKSMKKTFEKIRDEAVHVELKKRRNSLENIQSVDLRMPLINQPEPIIMP